MKRKLILGIAALLMLFTACQKSEMPQTVEQSSDLVTMGVQLFPEMAQTKSLPNIPEGHSLRCIMAIENLNNPGVEVIRQEVLVNSDNVVFSFQLPSQGEYRALLWADYITSSVATDGKYTDTYYTTLDLNAVTLTDVVPALPEYRESFYASLTFTKEIGAVGLNARLDQPVMVLAIWDKYEDDNPVVEQLNIDEYDAVSTVKAEYKVYSTFNVATGVPSNLVDRTTEVALTSREEIVAHTYSKLLFEDYVFAHKDNVFGEIKLHFTQKEGSTLDIAPEKTIPMGIPEKQDWIVNAAGKLITAEPSSDVTLSLEFEDNWSWEDKQDVD